MQGIVLTQITHWNNHLLQSGSNHMVLQASKYSKNTFLWIRIYRPKKCSRNDWSMLKLFLTL